MPLFWIIVLVLGGTAIVYTYAKAPPTSGPRVSPSAKPWPGNVTTADVQRAVQIALSRENEPNKLKAFASVLERFDINLSKLLTAKARQIELARKGILVEFNPNQTGPLR